MLLLDALFIAYSEKVMAADVAAFAKFTAISCPCSCFCLFSFLFLKAGDLRSELMD